MKKTLIATLCLILILSGCGAAETAPDMQAVYAEIESGFELHDMMPLVPDMMFDFLGVDPETCTQAVTAICGDSLRADEIWLIEAKDEAAAAAIAALAQSRLEKKASDAESYLPDQYLVITQAEVVQEGLCVAVFVSPDAAAMAELFRSKLG